MNQEKPKKDSFRFLRKGVNENLKTYRGDFMFDMMMDGKVLTPEEKSGLIRADMI